MEQDQLVSPVAHIPGVFSHYGPTTGSALITKVAAHARAIEEVGGEALILVNESRQATYPNGRVIPFRSPRSGHREWFTARERRIDALLARSLGTRPMTQRFFKPALDAVPSRAAAAVIYNQPGAISRRFSRAFPGLKVLHLGNDVFNSWPGYAIRKSLAQYDLTLAVSGFVAEMINRRAGRDGLVKVLRNGVDVEQFHPKVDHAPSGPPVILFLGNMVAHKGAHNLIAAAVELRKRGVSAQVHVVGSWGLGRWDNLTPYEKGLRGQAAALGPLVRFHPFVPRNGIPEVFRRADIFCMPVEWDEPAGQVVTEAMASGLPVVSADRGGIREYLGPDGRYADPKDHHDLADALEELVCQPDRRRQLGDRLRRRAEGMSWETRMWEFNDMLLNAQARRRS